MKTAIGYKLFRVSKKYPGKLFPLYVNANTNIPIGEWISAEPGERLENGKVKSKLGPLRYRPGFHINDVAPYVSHIGQKVNGKITYMRPDTVWAMVEYCIDHDYCEEAEANGISESGKFNNRSKNSLTSIGTPLKKSLFCIKQYNIKCFYLF